MKPVSTNRSSTKIAPYGTRSPRMHHVLILGGGFVGLNAAKVLAGETSVAELINTVNLVDRL